MIACLHSGRALNVESTGTGKQAVLGWEIDGCAGGGHTLRGAGFAVLWVLAMRSLSVYTATCMSTVRFSTESTPYCHAFCFYLETMWDVSALGMS